MTYSLLAAKRNIRTSTTMCGIAGAFAFGHNAEPINHALVMRLNDLQRRRGPDGDGLWASADDASSSGTGALRLLIPAQVAPSQCPMRRAAGSSASTARFTTIVRYGRT